MDAGMTSMGMPGKGASIRAGWLALAAKQGFLRSSNIPTPIEKVELYGK